MAIKKIKRFFELEAAAGIFIAAFALIAIFIANSPFNHAFENLLESEHIIRFDNWQYSASLREWIKEGLMTIFFFHVALEIKKEILVGSLSNPKTLAMPIIGAIGGMVVPALIYLLIAKLMNAPQISHGWPIPVATDIAFAIAALAVVGKNIPNPLRVFLLTLAVVDDLGAIALIAGLFGHDIDYISLAIAIGFFATLLLLSFLNFRRPWIFVVGGIFIWAYMLKSGFHPTLAGVLTAMAVPLKSNSPNYESPLEDLHDDFSAWVKYLILPLFALSNAGFSVQDFSLDFVLSPLVLAIFFGLFIGKPIGILGFIYLAKSLKIVQFARGMNFQNLFGASILCAIGFTMSLFLASLAFENAQSIIIAQTRFAVLLVSIIATLIGVLVLKMGKTNITIH